ncbi:Uncharacterized protein SCF082_LOCUS19333 [Durusdinium trenchii]|uniref:FACT complex subunit n=1 Tax=Durusdinium trenchii TaxID=1381693 RepID=A0ABP0KW20_9DINO
MAISPWAAKTKKSEVKDDSSEPSAKVPCTQYEKQLKKMEGNVGLVKELLGHMAWIRQQIQGSKGETVVHPGQLILNTLACENAELTAQSLEAWFQEYASKRAAMGVNVIFKEASKTVIESTMNNDVIKVPITAIKVAPLSLKIIKGYTKTQCVLFTLLAAADVDLSAPDAMELLKPLFPVLDYAWLLPAHVRINVDAVTCSYLNMVLSLRGVRADQGVHAKELATDQRLRKVIQEFQDTPGFLSKWALDEDKIIGIHNIITGTCEEARDCIRQHLNAAKWVQSAFNVELLRRPRWLLGAGLKGVPDCFKKVLTVKPESQRLFMKLVVQKFTERSRKVRPNQRARVRLSSADWDAYVNYACVLHSVMEEALVSLAGAAVQSVEDLEADVDSAEFAAIRTKIAMLWLIEKFLERQCFMGVVPDVGNMPSSDQFVRKAVLESQAPPEHMHYVAYVDFTKLGGKKSVIFHSTMYDGALERAAIEAQTPVFSVSADAVTHKLSCKIVRNTLLEGWKKGEAKGPEFSVKFVAEPPSLPEITKLPEMTLCKIMDHNTVAIPSDIRQRFLRDPLRSKEWKEILAEFDKKFEATSQGQPAQATPAAETESGAGKPESSWKDIFPDSPEELTVLDAMDVSSTFPLGSGSLVCKVIEGPQYFICATTSSGSFDTAEAVFLHNGGTWLLDGKAAKALQDKFLVCEDEHGADSQVQSLRACLQQIERDGLVDFKLGGHSADRPGQVFNGHSEDMFNVVPKEDNPMVWKPNAVQLRQLKYSSCASYVDAEKLTASPALEVAACFN